MAINIYSGSGSGSSKSKANSAAKSVRAAQAKAALQNVPAETSDSGATAVKTGGTLQKIGNVVGKVAGIAGKFLPGIGGTIAKGISNLLNDPEWWQQVPGDALTLNESLRLAVYDDGPSIGSGASLKKTKYAQIRGAIAEIRCQASITPNSGAVDSPPKLVSTVITPTFNAINQYLLPQVRKVVNAVPLQEVECYRQVLMANATLYAIWRDLRKLKYMMEHGQTYVQTMNDVAFPLFKTSNAAWVQSTINRLEEYLRANVRLPHTMCEYLAWRFGRVYKSNDSAKSALILYSTVGINYGPSYWDAIINTLMNIVSSDPGNQKANTDLYNTYYDHDYLVEIRDDTQFSFDKKEFMLRLNLQYSNVQYTEPTSGSYMYIPNFGYFTTENKKTIVAIDSQLDNPTAFMASTVSSVGQDESSVYASLFCVHDIIMHIPQLADNSQYINGKEPAGSTTIASWDVLIYGASAIEQSYGIILAENAEDLQYAGSDWTIQPSTRSALWSALSVPMNQDIVFTGTTTQINSASVRTLLAAVIASKSCDLYNLGITVLFGYHDSGSGGSSAFSDTLFRLDVTALSIDAGQPTLRTIATEHIYAFANLVDIDRKHSMSYKSAEKLVARDTANLVESLDVATASSK